MCTEDLKGLSHDCAHARPWHAKWRIWITRFQERITLMTRGVTTHAHFNVMKRMQGLSMYSCILLTDYLMVSPHLGEKPQTADVMKTILSDPKSFSV